METLLLADKKEDSMKIFTRKLISAFLTSAMAFSVLPAGIFTAEAAEDKTVDLVLFMGQSNMAGRGEADQAPAVPEGHGYEFRAVTDPTKLYPITEPFGENENNDNINDASSSGANRRAGGMVSALVNAYYEASGVPIVGVQCSQGGQSTKYFKQDAQLAEAVSRYTAAANYLRENGYTIRHKFMVWCQGESDGYGIKRTSEETMASSVSEYKTRTTQIFNHLEANAGIEKEFMVRTGHYNYNYYASPTEEKIAYDDSYLRIANAQTEIAAGDEQIELVASFYTDFAFENMLDQYHYHQNVYNSVGTMAGHNIAAAYDSNVEPVAVPPTVVEPDPTPAPGSSIEVSFNFNDDTVTTDPGFIENGNNKSSCAYQSKTEDASDKYLYVSASGGSTSSIASSYMDLTKYTEGAETVDISFDMHIPYTSKSCVGLVDKALRGDNYGGSSGSTYSHSGDIFYVLGEKQGRLNINEASSISTSIGSKLVYNTDQMKWAHYDVSIDFQTKKMSYSVSAIDGSEVYKSAQNIVFADTACTAFTGIEVYSWTSGEQLSLDNLNIRAVIPDVRASITGAESILKTKGRTVTSAYSIEKNYTDDNDVFEWSVSGVDGVTINKDTGVLSAEPVAGNGTAAVKATVVSSSKLTAGTEYIYNVEILDFAVVKDFEITSSDASIDISSLAAYGTDTFRIYKADGSYETVTASGNAVSNTSGGEVTVVPEYKFEFTNQTGSTDPLIAGYVKVGADSYKDGNGYGLTSADYKIDANGCLPKEANPIKIDLPDGFYDMTIYRVGGGHADVYSNGRLIVQNGSAATGQNRAGTPAVFKVPGMKIEGGNADIYTEDGRTSEKIASIKIAKVPAYARKPVVWVAGDSESADYYPIDADGDDLQSSNVMRTGIGTQIRKLLSDKYSVANFAQQSYTAADWVGECLEPFSYFVQAGDTILINFGMNDVKKSNAATAKENMAKIITAAKNAGAQAVLVSPIYAQLRKPLFNYVNGTNEMEAFAKEQGVPFIDLNKNLQEYINSAAESTGDPNWILNNYHVDDYLHLNQYSALLAADIIAAGLKKLGYETTDFAYEYTDAAPSTAKRTYSIAAVETMVEPYVPAATPEPTATPVPGKVLYSEDFESYDVGSAESKYAGWSTSYGTLGVYQDGSNKYLGKASNGSTSSRSAYIELPDIIDKDFVFEADLRFEANTNVSSFEIVEKRQSIYTNHGVYSNEQYAFKLARPRSGDVYVVNNTRSDSNLYLADYNQPAVTTDTIGDAWVHVKVIGNFDKKTTIAYITSLDGQTEYYHGVTDMSEGMTGWKCLMLMSCSDTKYSCIDNIEIREATEYDLAPQYHKVTISDAGASFDQYVLDGESVINIPSDVDAAYGADFEGWQVGDKVYSTAELAVLPITGDCVITSKIKDSYIEPLESVEFGTFPDGNTLTMGADSNTFADNIISLKITGARGTSLVLNPNANVTDYKIDWTIDGFRTLEGRATSEQSEFGYCDSYGLVEISDAAQSTINFKLKNTAANYYGRITAKVTYNGKSITVSKPLVVLGDKSGKTILPRGGYTSDFNNYESTLVGTEIIDANSVAFDGWTMSSGYKANSRYASLASESGKKFIRFTRAAGATSGDAYLCNQIGQISSQTLFEQDVRFNISGADIYYADNNKAANGNEAFILNFDGSAINLNGVKAADAAENTWYRIKVSVSPDTKTVSCKVYNESGSTLLGEADAEYKGSVTTQSYYVLKPAVAVGTVDINNVTVTDTAVDSSTFAIAADETAAIPASGSVTLNITAAARTTSGFTASDKAVWSIDGTADGVSIAADAADSHKAVMTITSDASSGYIPVKCTIDGVSVTKTIKLTGDKDNVAFETAPAGVMIPASGSNTSEYKAVVRNGQAEEISGKAVSYAIGTNTAGVSIDPETGILTVTNNAAPGTITITASSTDTSGNAISKTVNVKLYNLKFSLGHDTAGYTTVNPADEYSDSVGYGITGTASSNGSALTGSGFGFNVKLERGKVYRITAKYTGELVYEKKDDYMTGIIPTEAKLGKGQSYMDIALFGDDILDISFTGEGTITSVEITPIEKTKPAKPDWWTIGDSTVAQGGSWGDTLGNQGDFEKYPEILNLVNAFHNSGSAGRHHMSFYTAGWFNYILVNMNPGDIVSISGMGTNNSSSTKEMFEQFNNFYIDAIEDMGGYVVLGTYTPTGNYGDTEGKVYDADNMIFKGRRTYAYEQAIRDVYEARKNEEQVIGFVDIGKMVDEKMTADVQRVYSDAISAGSTDADARAAANARATELMGYWKDFNHYYIDLSRYFQPELIAEMVTIISGIDESESKEKVVITYENGAVTVTRNDSSIDTAVLIRASYSNGRFVSAETTELDFANGNIVTPELKNAVESGDRFFVWNSIDGLEPLCEAYVVK